jgi:hypothetical protein
MNDSPIQRITAAIDVAYLYGMEAGAHHKQWVIDQMLRALLGSRYDGWVAIYDAVMQFPDKQGYAWDEGVAP